MTETGKEIIVVIGSGRSGTSLLTRMLVALGMDRSARYILSSEQNPEGTYEDAEIVDVQKDLFTLIQGSPSAPLRHDFLNVKGVGELISKLKTIVEHNVTLSKNIWGFKDPRTASLLPLWSKVFNPLKLVPKYVLAVRNPSAVVMSLNRQYNNPYDSAELLWLVRTCDALYYSGGNCFIVHYEDWFNRDAKKVTRELANFCELNVPKHDKALNELLAENVRKSLNRSGHDRYEVKNPYVNRLYRALSQCHGTDFDHDSLMQIVVECRESMQSFSPWLSLRSQQSKTNDKMMRQKLATLRQANKQFQAQSVNWQEEIQKQKGANSKLLLQSEKRLRELNALEVSIQSLKSQNEILKDSNTRLQEKSSAMVKDIEEVKMEMSQFQTQSLIHGKEIEKYKDDNQKLLLQHEKRQEELTVYKADTLSLKSQNEKLKKSYTKLLEKSSAMVKDIEEVKMEMSQFQTQSLIHGKEIEKYKDDNQKLLLQHEKGQEELTAYKADTLSLKAQNQVLKNDNLMLEQKLNSVAKVTREIEFENSQLDARSNVLESDNKRLVEQTNRQLHELVEFKALITNIKVESVVYENRSKAQTSDITRLQNTQQKLKKRIKTLQIKNENKERRIERKEEAINALQTSSTFRIGQTFVQAVAQPGKNTILFPYYLLKEILNSIFVRKH
ncbi:hypothetical protein ACFL3I_09015 [Pseudomonadota bacterium]